MSEWIYIGTDPKCGHVVAACVDDPEDKKYTAKFVANLVRRGFEITRVQESPDLDAWCREECPRMIEIRAKQRGKQKSLAL